MIQPMIKRYVFFLALSALALILVPQCVMATGGEQTPFFITTGDPIGLTLIATGLVLLIAEIFVISHGILALCGVLFFMLGSALVVHAAGPAARMLWMTWLSSGLFLVAGIAATTLYALRLYRRNHSHQFALAGQKALVIDWDGSRGRVEVDGAFWNARSDTDKPYRHGEWVTITKQDNLTLLID